uniref:Uncharacterized protein n=1 Tax=Anopheles melas TaxID=34690 RepID=A0A182UFU7_9DIPT
MFKIDSPCIVGIKENGTEATVATQPAAALLLLALDIAVEAEEQPELSSSSSGVTAPVERWHAASSSRLVGDEGILMLQLPSATLRDATVCLSTGRNKLLLVL